MIKIIHATVLLVVLALSGCTAVTITESGLANFDYRPNYEHSKPFYLWGFIGEHHIDVTKICTKERPAIQMQTKYSALDVLYSTLTLGFYLPRTAKVWCKREAEA